MKQRLFIVAASLVMAIPSHAVLIMDQIGSNPADNNGIAAASQHFETGFQQYDIAMIDDFVVSGSAMNITSIDAGLQLFNNANATWPNVGDFDVDIFSSVGAAASNLTGDVFHTTVLHANATINTSYYTLSQSALVTLPVSFNLNPGTYYLGVIPHNTFGTNGQTGVIESTYAAGFPNGNNAVQANPGGGFGFTGGTSQLTVNASYRITGSPVPEPASMAVLGIGALALIRRRRGAK